MMSKYFGLIPSSHSSAMEIVAAELKLSQPPQTKDTNSRNFIATARKFSRKIILHRRSQNLCKNYDFKRNLISNKQKFNNNSDILIKNNNIATL